MNMTEGSFATTELETHGLLENTSKISFLETSSVTSESSESPWPITVFDYTTMMMTTETGLNERAQAETLLDQTTSRTIETVINVGLLPCVGLVGVVTNVLNIVIFAKQGLKDRINVCLLSLALADCGYLLSLLVYKSFSLLSLFSSRLGNFWKVRSLNTIIAVFWGFSSTSNLLTMLVALERCVCVVSPLRAKRLLKTKLMIILIVLIYVVILSSSSIFNVKFQVAAILEVNTNNTIYIAALSDFYLQHKVFVDIVYNYVLAIVIPFTSLVVVIVSTILTVVFLRRASTWKAQSANVSAEDRKEAAITKMLLLVCYVYVICVTPSVVNAFVVQFVDGWIPTGRYSNTFYVYVALMHLLTALNSSINFFIYYSRGSKFRSTFRDLCCGCRQQADTPSQDKDTIVTDISRQSVDPGD